MSYPRLLRLCLGGWVLGIALAARGFVATPDSAGRLPYWDLVNPDSTTAQTNLANPYTKAVRYFIAADAYSATNRVAELNSVRACFAQWEAIPGSILRFEEGGLIYGPADIDNTDYTNTVFWTKNTTWVNGGMDNISGVLGLAVYTYFDDNTIAECDIVLNGAQFEWTTTPTDTSDLYTYFIEPTLLHEIGHLVGLDHSPVGGANLMARGESGLGLGIGLTSDETAAVRSLYPRQDWLLRLGNLQGVVTLNGTGVFGAVVTAEDAAGNLVSGTVSRQGGLYTLPALPPGAYQVRVTPLDPTTAASQLLSGNDISRPYYSTAQTGFLPSTPQNATVGAGETATVNVALTAGTPAFRITRIRIPTRSPSQYELINAGVSVAPGQSDVYVGVLSPDLPTAGATLGVSGDGVTVGTTQFKPAVYQNYNLISATLSVEANATPGLRTLSVRRGNDVAYANGFLVIAPPVPDVNFDGLDDRFQRRYFPLFTAPEAGPAMDPDGDGFDNLAECTAGSNPLDPQSYLRIRGIRPAGSAGVALEWLGAAGKKYQITTRSVLPGAAWTVAAPLVLGTGELNQWTGTTTTPGAALYRLQAIP